MQQNTQISISRVQNAREKQQFLRMPWQIYNKNSQWIPQLLLESQNQLNPKHPYFEHGKVALWLARQAGKVVGRIGAQFDSLHQTIHGDGVAFFSFLEAINEPTVFETLLTTAEQWALEQGATALRGPFNLSINGQSGLLIEGFDAAPVMMMNYAPPYYAERLAEQHYALVQELWAYRLDARFSPPPAMQSLARKLENSVTIRPLSNRHLQRDFELLRAIFNDAWSGNWGFLPFTEAEFAEMASQMRSLITAQCVQIAEVEGDAAGMIVLLPNLNEWIRDLNGRLFPINFLKLLYRIYRKRATSGRVPLMGIRQKYRQSLIGTALAVKLIESLRPAATEMGLKWVELSWILADNAPMNRLIQNLGGERYKRYGVFEKAIYR